VNVTDTGYRGPQVCSIVGITYRQLDYWARTDLIRPSVADAKGSGTQRRYGYRDLVELKVVKSLLDAGVALQSARRAIEYLRAHVDDDMHEASLVISGSSVLVARTPAEVVNLMRNGEGVLTMVLSLGAILAELEAAIVELRPRDDAA
jgi:DNA-binding transcriptional MerR regulator